jgi:hypothetical protein
VGAKEAPFRLSLTNNPIVSIASGGDIYVNNIGESDINIDSISSQGHVSLKTASGIKNNRTDTSANIDSKKS